VAPECRAFAGRWVGEIYAAIIVVVPLLVPVGVAFGSIPCIFESFFWRIWSWAFWLRQWIEFVTFSYRFYKTDV